MLAHLIVVGEHELVRDEELAPEGRREGVGLDGLQAGVEGGLHVPLGAGVQQAVLS